MALSAPAPGGALCARPDLSAKGRARVSKSKPDADQRGITVAAFVLRIATLPNPPENMAVSAAFVTAEDRAGPNAAPAPRDDATLVLEPEL